jgi:hypothetical protein
VIFGNDRTYPLTNFYCSMQLEFEFACGEPYIPFLLARLVCKPAFRWNPKMDAETRYAAAFLLSFGVASP